MTCVDNRHTRTLASLSSIVLLLIAGCSSHADLGEDAFESSAEYATPPTLVAPACAAAREAERSAAADAAASSAELESQAEKIRLDTEAAFQQLAEDAAAAASKAQDHARLESSQFDPDGQFSALIRGLQTNLAPRALEELWEITELAWQRVDREQERAEAEMAVRHVSAFRNTLDYAAYEKALPDEEEFFRYLQGLSRRGHDTGEFWSEVHHFGSVWRDELLTWWDAIDRVAFILLMVAVKTEQALGQAVLDGEPLSATSVTSLAESTAREEWESSLVHTDDAEAYPEEVRQTIIDASRVVGRTVQERPGPHVRIATSHVSRIADLESSPLVEDIERIEADARQAQAQVAASCN